MTRNSQVFLEVEADNGSRTAVEDFGGILVFGFKASLDAAQRTDYTPDRTDDVPQGEVISSHADIQRACQAAGACIDLANTKQ